MPSWQKRPCLFYCKAHPNRAISTTNVTIVYLRQAPHYLLRAEPRSAKCWGRARAGVQRCVTAAMSARMVVTGRDAERRILEE